jgi:tetratricopeptide (TPR) repeat protein
METCREAGDATEALKHGKALLLLPLDESGEVPRSVALASLARLYEDEGERAKASELYARALESNPSHEEALLGVARTR